MGARTCLWSGNLSLFQQPDYLFYFSFFLDVFYIHQSSRSGLWELYRLFPSASDTSIDATRNSVDVYTNIPGESDFIINTYSVKLHRANINFRFSIFKAECNHWYKKSNTWVLSRVLLHYNISCKLRRLSYYICYLFSFQV